MRTNNIPKSKNVPIKSPDLALSSTLIGSNYPCLELFFIVPKVFEPLKFDCILLPVFDVHVNLKNYHIMGSNSQENDRIASLDSIFSPVFDVHFEAKNTLSWEAMS